RLAYKPDAYLEVSLSYQDTGRKAEIRAIGAAVIPNLEIRT
ncbi:MAG: bifunctional alanine racemase/tRNA (adenosine(37)-N6)-threonylcarbamoyltransferase complex ATPase subunit type 1 TsaE, partial [Leptolyngbya sp. ERB_1_2]